MNSTMQHKQRILIAMAVVAMPLTIAGTAFAATSTAAPHTALAGLHRSMTKPATIGTVSAVSGNTITVAGKNGTVYSIDVSSAKITEGYGASVQTLTATQVKVGDMVIVMGTTSGNTISATSVVDGVKTPNAGTKAHTALNKSQTNLMGTVSAISGSGFTVTVQGRSKTAVATTYTITTTGATTYAKNGAVDTASDLAVGQKVMIVGTVDTTAHTASATSVNIIIPVARANGTVQSISGSTITLSSKKGITYSIDASSAKIISGFGKTISTPAPTIASISTGQMIIAEGAIGTKVGATNFAATTLRVFTPKK